MPVVVAALFLAGGCSARVAVSNRPSTTFAVAPSLPPSPVPPPAAPVPAAPAARPWPCKRLFDIDYVDVRTIARSFNLSASWVINGRVMQLADRRGVVRMRFEVRDPSYLFDGTRVFLGSTTVFDEGSLFVSKIDVIKTIIPLLRPAEYAAELPPPPRLIVLDPGHGGSDPGTRNLVMNLDEKNLTLDVVLRLRKLLEARGYRVILTRSTDTKLAQAQRTDLQDRDEVANRAKADLFLSVHFNSAPATVTGTETYAMTPQFQASSGAAKDTAVDNALPGNRQDIANALLGYHLQRSVLAELHSADRGFKRGRLMVLCFPQCPAALVEAAYLSNYTDARRLATPVFRQQIAQALADGIDEYSAALAALRPVRSVRPEQHFAAGEHQQNR